MECKETGLFLSLENVVGYLLSLLFIYSPEEVQTARNENVVSSGGKISTQINYHIHTLKL